MRSKWYELKPEAIRLRRQGLSLGKIEAQLGIPRSTLSGWLKNVQLTKKQKDKLYANWKNALVIARKSAVKWHNAQRQARITSARNEALKTLRKLDTDHLPTLEIALSILYLGEGSKKNVETGLGSSDVMILDFYLSCLEKLYGVVRDELRYELYLRADQDPEEMLHYWSKQLRVSKFRFKNINLDKRTIGKKTYKTYKGVCNIRGGGVAIQRKLMYLSECFCKEVARKSRVRSSAG